MQMNNLQTANDSMWSAWSLYRAKRRLFELGRIDGYEEVNQAWDNFRSCANAYQLERRANGLTYIIPANDK